MNQWNTQNCLVFPYATTLADLFQAVNSSRLTRSKARTTRTTPLSSCKNRNLLSDETQINATVPQLLSPLENYAEEKDHLSRTNSALCGKSGHMRELLNKKKRK